MLNIKMHHSNIEIEAEAEGKIHFNIQHGFRMGNRFFNFNVAFKLH